MGILRITSAEIDDGTFSGILLDGNGNPDMNYPDPVFWVHRNRTFNPHKFETWVLFRAASGGFERFGAVYNEVRKFRLLFVPDSDCLDYTPEKFEEHVKSQYTAINPDLLTHLYDPANCALGNAKATDGLFLPALYAISQPVEGSQEVTAWVWRRDPGPMIPAAQEMWLLADNYVTPSAQNPTVDFTVSRQAAASVTNEAQFRAWVYQNFPGANLPIETHHGHITMRECD